MHLLQFRSSLLPKKLAQVPMPRTSPMAPKLRSRPRRQKEREAIPGTEGGAEAEIEATEAEEGNGAGQERGDAEVTVTPRQESPECPRE